ncbi:MAG: M42 family metallopeptidase [Chloroflexota bacterium]
MKELIKSFVEAYGPSGNEEQVREVIAKAVKPYVDEVYTDALGNLIAVKKGTGKGKRIMVSGHMDEIGLMVIHIDDKGFIRFGNVGGQNPVTLMGCRVRFANGTQGVIGSERVDDVKDLRLEKLFIDIGAATKADAEKKVKIGDVAIFDYPFTDLGDVLVAKAMDDRIACAVMVAAAKEMKKSPNDVHFVFSVQEEVGLRGARTAAYGVDPEIGIALDVCPVGDTPKARTLAVSLGKGAAIKIKDASVICHPKVVDLLTQVANKNKVVSQREVLEAGGTDTGAIHLNKAGVPSGCISIPTRYLHGPSEMVNYKDVLECVMLLTKTLESKIDF